VSIFCKVYQTDPRNEDGEKREVIELFMHSLYNDTSFVGDLCLLKVCEKSIFFCSQIYLFV